jgi:hypothetical protein
MKNFYIEIGDTCGIEYETENLVPNDLNRGELNDVFRPTHDASIETDQARVGNLIINLDELKKGKFSSLLSYSGVTVGTELVSVILNSRDRSFIEIIKDLTNFLCEMGEGLTGERSGIHFHFSLPNPNLRILKSLVRLGKYLETVFYTVGCFGYEFRGLKNDFIYCRPITKFGPPCVPYGKNAGFVQSYNIHDLLKTESVPEFWEKYGDLQNHRGRYNAIRYSWLNLYPLFPNGDYKGTVEFRVFNKTLNSKFIYASALLCRAFVNYAIKSSYNSLLDDDLLHENSIYNDNITKEDVVNQLLTFSGLSKLEDDVLEILLRIIDISEIPYAEKKFVHTHLRRDVGYYWQNSEYSPEIIDKNYIFKPEYVDIHVLRGDA